MGYLNMRKLRAIASSGQIHVSLAIGISIIAVALASKYLSVEIGSFSLAIPGLIVLGYEFVVNKKGYERFAKSWYWVLAILLSTSITIFLYWN